MAPATRSHDVPPFFVYDDPDRLQNLMHCLSITGTVIPIARVEETFEAWKEGLPVIALEVPKPIEPGIPRVETLKAVLNSINQAVDAVQAGKARAIVTNPIHKEVLYPCRFLISWPYRISRLACCA